MTATVERAAWAPLVEAISMSVTPDDMVPVLPLDVYYSPQRVRDLLRLYVYLTDSRPPKDPEMDVIVKRVFGPSGWREEAAAKRADIYRALMWLEVRSIEAQYVIRASYCVGLPLRDITPYMVERFGRDVHFDTLRRWRDDGVQLMSDYLCGVVRNVFEKGETS